MSELRRAVLVFSRAARMQSASPPAAIRGGSDDTVEVLAHSVAALKLIPSPTENSGHAITTMVGDAMSEHAGSPGTVFESADDVAGGGGRGELFFDAWEELCLENTAVPVIPFVCHSCGEAGHNSAQCPLTVCNRCLKVIAVPAARHAFTIRVLLLLLPLHYYCCCCC